MHPTDAEVEQAARDFRAAIDAAGPAPWALKHIVYPRGACGHAAELLGRYLIERLGITADYVNQDAPHDIGGWRHSHAWLEWNGLTIDISGDQFGWEPVIVTRTPQYHGKGEPRSLGRVRLVLTPLGNIEGLFERDKGRQRPGPGNTPLGRLHTRNLSEHFLLDPL